ncbi:hypothetical protein AB833_08330 [Chromatiales bacterium (ex Bugula neritina AB1)]|nr:hypothetical protein AB833_08330 [Chromatiales bacterium (ex Bugula neritina AB1)]
MSYLRKFDIDYIKIDRSFVKNLPEATDDLVLCRAIIAIADSLGLRVVAEGVETDEQMQLLAREGCDYIQGYILSKPVDAQIFESRLLSGRMQQTKNSAGASKIKAVPVAEVL